MKTFKVSTWGIVPQIIKDLTTKLNNAEATKDAIFVLNEDINFIVCDLREAHGNLNKINKDAWFAPRNGDNTYGVTIKW